MRGEIWTLRDTGYASKARPVVIVQSDAIVFDSVALCLFTTFDSADIPTRVRVEPSRENGLAKTSYVMTDKVASVDKKMLGEKIGKLDSKTMQEVSKKLALVLGIA